MPYGEVHPGADDNPAHGMCRLAKAFRFFPNREAGRSFSPNWDGRRRIARLKHWAANPTVPLDRVVAGLNFDMVGRLRDNRLILFGTRAASAGGDC